MMQIRRYLYGQLNDYLLARYISGQIKYLRVDGLIRFYPLINDIDKIRDFDGWLVSAIYKAMRERIKVLTLYDYQIDADCILRTQRNKIVNKFNSYKKKGKKIIKIPSMYLLSQAINKKIGTEGLASVIDPKDNQYNY